MTVDSSGRCVNLGLHAIEHHLRHVAEFDQYARRTWDDIASSGLKYDIAKVPHAVRATDLCKALHEVMTILDQGTASIFAQVHWGGAGVVSLPSTCYLDAADANDAGDDTDFLVFSLKTRPLLNMAFEISDMPIGIERDTTSACIPCLSQGFAQALALLVFRHIHVCLRKLFTERQATRQRTISPFFIGKRNDVNAEISRSTGFEACASDFQAVQHAHSTIEPSPFRD